MHDVDRDWERRGRAAVRAVKRNLPWLLDREGNEQIFRSHMETESDEVLADLARVGEKTALEILRERIRILHEAALHEGRASLVLHDRVRELALEVFLYGPPKSASGPKATRTAYRDRTIALLVKIVHVDYGFPIYGNPQHRGRKDAPLSAVRLVADELAMTERAVDDIWRDNKDAVMRHRKI
jgi:hypothetical protein